MNHLGIGFVLQNQLTITNDWKRYFPILQIGIKLSVEKTTTYEKTIKFKRDDLSSIII